jgi:23S rRNA (cytosine1962-C5)-methyltransferase
MAPVLSSSPETLVTRGWSDYALLDSGDGRKLERYGR